MKNVLIINGHQKYEGIANGGLSQFLVNHADDFLKEAGYTIQHTLIQNEYNIQEELDKFSWADCIFFQFPTFWMGTPWLTKKYIDDIFSAGYGTVTYDGGEGNENNEYGTSGLMKEKKYMLSLTYNAPLNSFSNKTGFFEGLSLDEVNVATHKTFKYCGATPLESYAMYDVYNGKLDMTKIKSDFLKVLKNNFI